MPSGCNSRCDKSICKKKPVSYVRVVNHRSAPGTHPASARSKLPGWRGENRGRRSRQNSLKVFTMTTMINETIEPELKGAERQELSHLDYFRRKIEDLRDRGLITGDSFATISSEIRLRREAIDRHGVYRAQLGRARKLVANKNLAGAKEWAERARLTEPDQREAWELEVRVCGTLERYEDAIVLCKEAVKRFPDMAATLLQLGVEQRRRDNEQKRRADVARDRERRVLQQEQKSIRKEPEPVLSGDGTVSPDVLSGEHGSPPPALSWSSVAGEFLQEHWQKLILCLAVLLIVVSSTVGAHLLLGEKLWSPLGKCSLAMVGTLMFAALGMVLIRWGAERAGQMMLVTTLIVVPIHFMLAGELRLVLEPSRAATGWVCHSSSGIARPLAHCRRHAGAGQGCLVPDRAFDTHERLQRHDGPSRLGALGVAVRRISGSRDGVSGCGPGIEAAQLGALRPGKPLVRQPVAGAAGVRPGDEPCPHGRLLRSRSLRLCTRCR